MTFYELCLVSLCFFFNDTATTEIYTLSLHDALPISPGGRRARRATGPHRPRAADGTPPLGRLPRGLVPGRGLLPALTRRSEEHTSELQSRQYIVCRLLLEKKKHPERQLHRTSYTTEQ